MLERLKNLWAYTTTRSCRTIAALEDENAAMRDQLGKRVMDDTVVTGIVFDGGGLDVGLKGGAAQLFAEALAHQCESGGAVNYLECRFTSRHATPGERYIVTIQKCSGQTPHQLREAAERELAELRATLKTPNVRRNRRPEREARREPASVAGRASG
jgi:hypothetical protein